MKSNLRDKLTETTFDDTYRMRITLTEEVTKALWRTVLSDPVNGTYNTANAIRVLELEPHLQFTAIHENNGAVDFWRLYTGQGNLIRVTRNGMLAEYIPMGMSWEEEP